METKAADKVGHIWSAECPVTAAPEGYEETTVRWTKTRSKQKAPEEEASTLWNALATATEHIKYPELRLIFEVGAKRQAFDFNVPVARGKQTAFGKQLAKLGLNIEVFARKFYHVDDEKKFVFFDDHAKSDCDIKVGKEAVQVTDVVGDTGEVKGDAEALARVEHDTVPASTRASSVTTAALVKPGEAREASASDTDTGGQAGPVFITLDIEEGARCDSPTPSLSPTRSVSPSDTAQPSTPPVPRFPPELLAMKIIVKDPNTPKRVLPPRRPRPPRKWVNEHAKPLYSIDYSFVHPIVEKRQRETDALLLAKVQNDAKLLMAGIIGKRKREDGPSSPDDVVAQAAVTNHDDHDSAKAKRRRLEDALPVEKEDMLLVKGGKRNRQDEVSASADVAKLASAPGANLDGPPMGKRRRVDA